MAGLAGDAGAPEWKSQIDRVGRGGVSAEPTPATWVIIGDKPGDNAQVELVARALKWPSLIRRLRFLPRYQTGKPSFSPSLHHLDTASSDPLRPPWPDLILTIGRRPSMAALWVKEQSGGRARLVIIGRPRRFLDRFDLILAPPQYHVPHRMNVLRLALPLLAVDATAIGEEATRWRDRLASLPRPLTAVLVGGPTGPFRFDAEVTSQFVTALARTTQGRGSLFVTTSRRTPQSVVEALASLLPATATLYRWREGDTENPYKALLGLADNFVVTGDSASMMVEVARCGRPLAIFRLPERWRHWQDARRRLGEWLQPGSDAPPPSPLLASLGDTLFDYGIVPYGRQFDELYQALLARGLATMLGSPFPCRRVEPPDDLPLVAARISALLTEHRGSAR